MKVNQFCPFITKSGQYYWSFQFKVSIFKWLLQIDNECFEQVVDKIYLKELKLNKIITSYTEAAFLDLN